jgi:hypothetical protein
MAELAARYRALLSDDSTFGSTTLEELLDAGALPSETAVAIRERHV